MLIHNSKAQYLRGFAGFLNIATIRESIFLRIVGWFLKILADNFGTNQTIQHAKGMLDGKGRGGSAGNQKTGLLTPTNSQKIKNRVTQKCVKLPGWHTENV